MHCWIIQVVAIISTVLITGKPFWIILTLLKIIAIFYHCKVENNYSHPLSGLQTGPFWIFPSYILAQEIHKLLVALISNAKTGILLKVHHNLYLALSLCENNKVGNESLNLSLLDLQVSAPVT